MPEMLTYAGNRWLLRRRYSVILFVRDQALIGCSRMEPREMAEMAR